MLEQLFERNLQRHKNAPLLMERIEYLNYLAKNGCTTFRLKLIEGYLLRAIELLNLDDNRIVTEKEIDAASLKWRKMKTTHHLKRSYSESGSGQRLFAIYTKSWLRYLNRLYKPFIEDKNKLFGELYKITDTLERHLNAPLLEERISYLEYQKNNGNKVPELKRTASYLLRIVELLHLEDGRCITFKELIEAANKWGRTKKQGIETPFYKYGKKHFVNLGLSWLKFIRRLKPSPEENDSLLICLFRVRYALFRQIEYPLLKERLQFLHYRKKQGVKNLTLHHAANTLLNIMDNLDFYSLRPVKTSELVAMADKWSESGAKYSRTPNYIHKNKLSLMCVAKIWLSILNCLTNDLYSPIGFQKEMDDYLCYQLIDKGLSDGTIKSRRGILKHYLTAIEGKCSGINQVTPGIIDEIVARRWQMNLTRKTIRMELSILKSFFRFAVEKKWCIDGLPETIRIPKIYQHELLPLAPEREDLRKLIIEFKKETLTEIRDFAILQLLIVYGLRSSEIAALQLGDIDWRKELIYIRRSKGSKSQSFPLTQTVGDAIIHYLKSVRPNETALREIFVARVSPYRPLNNKSIYTIINRILKPMRLNIKSHGPHSLRHASATHLINIGFSLKEIGDYLGHKHMDTTRIYTKVDLTNLRKVADISWEEIL